VSPERIVEGISPSGIITAVDVKNREQGAGRQKRKKGEKDKKDGDSPSATLLPEDRVTISLEDNNKQKTSLYTNPSKVKQPQKNPTKTTY